MGDLDDVPHDRRRCDRGGRAARLHPLCAAPTTRGRIVAILISPASTNCTTRAEQIDFEFGLDDNIGGHQRGVECAAQTVAASWASSSSTPGVFREIDLLWQLDDHARHSSRAPISSTKQRLDKSSVNRRSARLADDRGIEPACLDGIDELRAEAVGHRYLDFRKERVKPRE